MESPQFTLVSFPENFPSLYIFWGVTVYLGPLLDQHEMKFFLCILETTKGHKGDTNKTKAISTRLSSNCGLNYSIVVLEIQKKMKQNMK